MNAIAQLHALAKTIFTTKDLALVWNANQQDKLNAKISYYVKQGDLIKLTRGVFAKSRDYNLYELATSIYLPSYVSCETVLREAGVIFQHYEAIFVASHWSKNLVVDQHALVFRKLKDEVLYNHTGVINQGNYSIATKERALLDMMYLFPAYYFDNLSPLDFAACFELVAIYNNKQLEKRLKKLSAKLC
jgi:hypothetical protein